MQTTNTRSVVVVAACLLFLAGGVVGGLLLSRYDTMAHGKATTPVTADNSPLTQELGLSPAQREQMREIWEGTRQKAQRFYEEAQALQKQRDDALVALLNDEQKAKFEKIAQDASVRFNELVTQREATFGDAVEKTKRILDDKQRSKYEEILRQRSPGPGKPAAEGLFHPLPHAGDTTQP